MPQACLFPHKTSTDIDPKATMLASASSANQEKDELQGSKTPRITTRDDVLQVLNMAIVQLALWKQNS